MYGNHQLTNVIKNALIYFEFDHKLPETTYNFMISKLGFIQILIIKLKKNFFQIIILLVNYIINLKINKLKNTNILTKTLLIIAKKIFTTKNLVISTSI